MFRHVSGGSSEDDSNDSISLTSTVFSEDDPDNTYIVENILAERWFKDEERVKYLVKWEGYPIERASWEPIDMFDDQNTINEWKATKQRHEAGDSSLEFDWLQWDKDREREAEEQYARKVRRLKKRQKLQKMMNKSTSSRGSRASSARIKGFVVSDDEIVISPEEESESDIQRSKRKKKRKAEDSANTEEEEESGNTSVDSLMETLAKKAKNKKKPKREAKTAEPKKQKTKLRGRSVDEESDASEADEMEDWLSEDQAASKKPLKATQNGRTTRPNRRPSTHNTDLEKNVAVTTSRLSKMDVQQRKNPVASTNPSLTPKALGSIPKSGPRRNTQITSLKMPDPAGLLPGVPKVGKFISLSQQNRVYKRGRNEPAPDINALELFHAGEKPSSRRISGAGGTTQPHEPRADEAQRNKEIIQQNDPGGHEGGDLRGPKRRKTEEGTKVQTFSLDGYKATLAKRRDSAQKVHEPNPVPFTAEAERPIGHEADNSGMDIDAHENSHQQPGGPVTADHDPWDSKKPPTGPAGWQNKISIDEESHSTLEPPIKPIFECELEMGPIGTEGIGAVTFTGFTSSFINFVEGLKVDRLWLSRFVEDAYVSNILVPEMGTPLEFADMEVDRDESQSLISALVILHGAGVILHEDFTILIFQPSNDKLRQAFKTPMQQQRTPLRAVLYPPFELPVPTKESPEEISFKKSIREQPMCGFYFHTLLERTLGVNCAEMLQNSKGSDNFIIYCPDIAQPEGDEMEQALRLLKKGGRWPVNEIPGRMEKYEKHGLKVKLFILVHFTLRQQLHLLPHIKHLKARDHVFYFFGARLERGENEGVLQTFPVRFWNFGTLIFLTPRFVIENEKATREVINYQKQKAASTTICYSPTMLAQAEANLFKNPENGEAVLRNVYALIDKRNRGEAQELQVQDVDGHNELEVISDAFAYHQLENCTRYRRFMIGHSKDEDTSTAIAGLYDCIEFHDPESLINELMQRAPGKPPPKKRPSESGPPVIESK